MNTRRVSITFGITFVLVGILGFFNNPIISAQGFFAVNEVHNVVHILLGIAFITACFIYTGREDRVLKFFGLGGLAVTAVGFLTPGDMMLGMVHVNMADHWLHLGLGLVVLVSGFIFKNEQLADH